MDPHQWSSLDSLGAHSTPPAPLPHLQMPACFSKTAMPKFRLDTSLQVCQKSQSHDLCFLRYRIQNNFLSFWVTFCPIIPLLTPKIKICNKCKKTWRYCPITHVYHKWRSYDVWFLRYKAGQAEFFLSFWAIFCPLTLLTTWKIKVLKKWKKAYIQKLLFYTCMPQMMIIWCMVPEIWSATDRTFCHFGPFFALLLH